MGDTGKVIPLRRAGQAATCERCGAPCKVSATTNTAATMLKHAALPKGNCINCAVAEWFVSTGLRETTEPSALLSREVHKPFEAVLKLAKADGTPAEIDWTKVVANWSLPFVVGHTPTGKAKFKSFPVFDMGQWRERLERTGKGSPGAGYADGTFSDRLRDSMERNEKGDA
jgi:hypothetical protein